MSTRARIGVTTRASAQEPINGFKVVYCHLDGTPWSMGYRLARIAGREAWDIEKISGTLLAHDWSFINEFGGETHLKHAVVKPDWGAFYTDAFHGPVTRELAAGPKGDSSFFRLYLFDAPTRALHIFIASTVEESYRPYGVIDAEWPTDDPGKIELRLAELESAWLRP